MTEVVILVLSTLILAFWLLGLRSKAAELRRQRFNFIQNNHSAGQGYEKPDQPSI
ncbi:MAG: hypothetical protein ACPGF7_12875 [Pontibacterium sp.]